MIRKKVYIRILTLMLILMLLTSCIVAVPRDIDTDRPEASGWAIGTRPNEISQALPAARPEIFEPPRDC